MSEEAKAIGGILSIAVAAAILYGVLHDNVTARLCVEYFTVGHPRVIASESPTALALVWGVLATWWFGAFLGVLLALAARAGRRAKWGPRDVVKPIGLVIVAVGIASFIGGCIGYCHALAHDYPYWLRRLRLSPKTEFWFVVDLWAHRAAYLAGLVSTVTLCALVAVRRSRGGHGQHDWQPGADREETTGTPDVGIPRRHGVGALGKRTISIAMTLVLVEAVAIGVPWQQRVRVSLTREGAAVSSQRFRLVSSDATDACDSRGLEGTTDINGRFEGVRRQWSSAVGLCAVLVRHDALCLLQPDGTWVRTWGMPYGPAPEAFALTCDLSPSRPSTTIFGLDHNGPCRLGNEP
jgi:hypothetical protein